MNAVILVSGFRKVILIIQLILEKKIEEESLGKRKHRKAIPWSQIRKSVPLYAGVAALVCHEYPLVIMLQVTKEAKLKVNSFIF